MHTLGKNVMQLGFRSGSDGKESACNVGEPGSIPGSGRSPGEGNVNLLQYSCLENSMDRGVWRVTVHGAAESWTGLRTEQQQAANIVAIKIMTMKMMIR